MAGFINKVKQLGRKLTECGTVVSAIKERAKARQRTIVLCEGEDRRVVEAAEECAQEGLAKIVLLGDPHQIHASNPDIDFTGIELIDPKTSPKLESYAALLYELRKAKGMTEEQAKEQAKDATFFGALMLKAGDADGLVSGACHSTANTLRPGLQIVKTAPGASAVSSFNLMVAPLTGNQYVSDGLLVFADCGLNPTYTAEGLADCAIATARSAKEIAGIAPRVAMLSFSSKGSAKHDYVSLVQEATRIAKEKAPDLAIDGELQFELIENPNYIEGVRRAAYELALNVNPLGSSIALSNCDLKDPIAGIAGAGFVTVFISALGAAVFRRKDLR